MIYHLRTFFLGLVVFSMTLLVLRVHHNQVKYMPMIVTLDVATEEPPVTFHTCSQERRKSIIKDVCRLARENEQQVGIRDDKNLKIVVADDERKILYCALAKTGTKSWLHYMVTLAGKVGPGHWHFRKPEFMKRAGLSYLRNVNVKDMRTKYKNYFKFLVARHPLQRLSAAYFEAIMKAGRYAKEDGSAPNFTDFSSRLDKDLYPQLHWSLYVDECQICNVDYDFIVKTETIDDDTRKLNEMIGSDVNLTVRHTNTLYDEKAEIDPFKYDHMYQDVAMDDPRTMQKVLRVYHHDLRTLGYQWSGDVSRCENDDGRGGVCC